jgi:phospholipid/cholesterol/gamma-HCH transport system substrate-binding protein
VDLLRRALRTYGHFFAAIVFFVILAAISGGYILINQRISVPFNDRYTVYADVTSSSGLAPGLGQAVNVAGVRVGQISGSKIVDGRARIAMEIDPKKLPHVYADARAELVADTPLKDLVIELGPGRPPAKRLDNGGVIPISRTSPPVDSDELTNALDADTRDYFDLVTSGFSTGLKGRGTDLNRLLRALGPTARQTREITSALAARRGALKRLVTNLTVLTKAAAKKDVEIGSIVETANATLESVAGQEAALRGTLDRLPGTLSGIRSRLNDARGFANELKPTLEALLPSVRKLPQALRDAGPLVRVAEPVLRTRLRPLVRASLPLAADLAPTAKALTRQTPDLIRAFQALTYTVNELAFNPAGSDEGYLYWLAWFAHNAASVGSTQDAQGPVTRGIALFSCDGLTSQSDLAQLLPLILTSLPVCP